MLRLGLKRKLRVQCWIPTNTRPLLLAAALFLRGDVRLSTAQKKAARALAHQPPKEGSGHPKIGGSYTLYYYNTIKVYEP